jgi:hypothetical protein
MRYDVHEIDLIEIGESTFICDECGAKIGPDDMLIIHGALKYCSDLCAYGCEYDEQGRIIE